MDIKKRKRNNFELINNSKKIEKILISEEADYYAVLNASDFIDSDSSYEHEIVFEFNKSNIQADIYIRVIMNADIKISVTVKVFAPFGIKDVDSKLDMKALILNEGSEITFVPALEIDEMDVSVDHKSTIGTPDQTWMTYMQSRGLSKKQVENLLVESFLKI